MEKKDDLNLYFLMGTILAMFVFLVFLYWRGSNQFSFIVEVLHVVLVVLMLSLVTFALSEVNKENTFKAIIVLAAALALFTTLWIDPFLPAGFPNKYNEEWKVWGDRGYEFVSLWPMVLAGLYLLQRVGMHIFKK